MDLLCTALLVLTVYLWITGGLGWIDAYESRENTELNLLGKIMVIVMHPVMSFVSIISQVIDDMKEGYRSVVDAVRNREGKHGSG